MKTTIHFSVMLLLSLSMVSIAVAQQSDVTHDTWTSGSPLPRGIFLAGAAVLGKRIIVVGGAIPPVKSVADTYIYNPDANTWSKGVPLPVPINSPFTAVVNNVLYVMGGLGDNYFPATNAVWAFDLQTKTWIPKSPLPTAAGQGTVVVERDNSIYVIGGWDGYSRLNNVQRYDPATDTWTEETPLLVAKSFPTAGRFGTGIVVADGYAWNGETGDTEGYNPVSNAWISGTPDGTPRAGACGGSIGTQLYVAGGGPSGGSAYSLTTSFSPSTNTWTRLADLPQRTDCPASAVYNGKLYCFGGSDGSNVYLKNVQIYQP